MKPPAYKDEHISALKLNLVHKAFDETLLEKISSKSVTLLLEGKAILIDTSIIGASHSVTLKERGKTLFSEVLANVDLKSALENEVLFFETRDTQEYATEIEGISYTFSSEVFDFEGDVLEKKLHLLQEQKSALFLEYDFEYHGVSKLSAKTVVSIRQMEQDIMIESAHVYPNEQQALLSKTILKRLGND